MAAEVCEAVFLDEVYLQGADGFDVAVGEGVCVPGLGPAVFVAVQEDDCCGEVMVVFDDVVEVGEAFTAFVDGGVARGEGVIDCVDYVSPSSCVLRLVLLPRCFRQTHSFKSLLTHDVSSHDIFAMTIVRSFGTIIGVVSYSGFFGNTFLSPGFVFLIPLTPGRALS